MFITIRGGASLGQALNQVSSQQRRTIGSVLVVDDDEAVLASWKRGITRERTCALAKDASSAIELARAQPFDLAITDLRLGADSGIEVIRAIKKHSPETLIVLCSGYLSVAAAVSAMHAGAEIVVFKPITFREILHHIERHDNDDLPELTDTPTLARAEWEHIMRVMADCNGNVSMAARRLGIYRSSLQRRLRKFAPRK
jgi:two-component system response regulator RegA